MKLVSYGFKDQSPCGWGKSPFPPSPTALATSQGLCGEYAGVAPTGSASGSSMRASAPPVTALWQAAASAAAALRLRLPEREAVSACAHHMTHSIFSLLSG